MFKMVPFVVLFFALLGDVTANPDMDAGFLTDLENDLAKMKAQLNNIKDEMNEQFHDGASEMAPEVVVEEVKPVVEEVKPTEGPTVTDEKAHWLYVCQNDKKKIVCPKDHLIMISESSFGRESNDHCPAEGFDADQACTTSLGSSAIEDKCGFKNECEVLADTSILGKGDSEYCQSIPKLASIKYSCKPRVVPETLNLGECKEPLDVNHCRQYASQLGKALAVNKDNAEVPAGCSTVCDADNKCTVTFTSVGSTPCGEKGQCLCAKAKEDEKPSPTAAVVEETKTEKPAARSTAAPGVVAVTLDCQELDMTATFDPNILPGDILNVSVSNCDDDLFEVTEDQTKVHVAFADCANNITQSDSIISQENIIAVVNGVKEKTNTVQRIVVYYYKLQCFFDRELQIHYGNAIEIKDREESFEQARKTAFVATMEMFTSPDFKHLSQSPYHVTAFAPIYMQIRGIHNNQLFKFIVQDCYATPTADPEDKKQYLFFDDKCKLDQTYKELHHGTVNKYMYKVNAFTFIKMKKQVYFHCDLLICKKDAKSEECKQKCATEGRRRRRRSLAENAGIETITVKSGQMSWDDDVYDRPLDQRLEAVKDELAEVIKQMKKE